MVELTQKFVSRRTRLVEGLVKGGVLRTPMCIRAMKTVKRELFVAENHEEYAYHDTPLPLGDTGQTISAPHMCAYMLEALDLEVGLSILEVGSGSGYHAALVAECVAPIIVPQDSWGRVTTVEVVSRLHEFAERNLERAGYSGRVLSLQGDGTLGVPPAEEKELYDRVLVTAGAPSVPEPLKKQVKTGGTIVIPVGGRYLQRLLRFRKDQRGGFREERMLECAFVPLVGRFGW